MQTTDATATIDFFPGITQSEFEETQLLTDILREPYPAAPLSELMDWLPEEAFENRTTGNVYSRLKILFYEDKPITLDSLRETLVRLPDDQVSIAIDDVAAILAGVRHE